jgi:hypothetical protein
VDTDEEVTAFREYAERCRKIARSSRNSKEWIAMAEQWDRLADTSGDGMDRLAQALTQLEADRSASKAISP